MKRTRKTVYVGLSGGVDSSVATLRLKKAGYNVVGVFIKVWHPEFLACDFEAERLDAMRVAAHLEIPFLTHEAVADYRRDVADHMISEYRAGRTPNPDVVCNTRIKFGSFLSFAKSRGADFVATGHYARIEGKKGNHHVYRGKDTEKDQSYFLWELSEKQLASILFPIGNSTKVSVRSEASKAGLPTATKKDSQGICFLGQVDMKDFLSHYMKLKSGDVLDEDGTVIGSHDGALFYTLGQRHGFTVFDRNTTRHPRFVTAKDVEKNTLTVGKVPKKTNGEGILLVNLNEIQPLTSGSIYQAQFRYRQDPFDILFRRRDDGSGIVVPRKTVETPARGQSAVIYQGEECIAGGIVAT